MIRSVAESRITTSSKQVLSGVRAKPGARVSSVYQVLVDHTISSGLSMLRRLRLHCIIRPLGSIHGLGKSGRLKSYSMLLLKSLFALPTVISSRASPLARARLVRGKLFRGIDSYHLKLPRHPTSSFTAMSTDAPAAAASGTANDDYQSLWANKYRGVR